MTRDPQYLFAARVQLWLSERREPIREAVLAYMLLLGAASGENNEVPRTPGLHWADRRTFLSIMRVFPSSVAGLPSAFESERQELANLITIIRDLSEGRIARGVTIRLHLLKSEAFEDALVDMGGFRGMRAFDFPPEGPIKIDLLAVEQSVRRWAPTPWEEPAG